MTRLQTEWQRLYRPGASAQPTPLRDPEGRVRALVLTLSRPADWSALSRVWQAVQSELALPAPAIAVSGTDGYQLWFSLAQAVPAPQAHAFLAALCARHLAHIAPARLTLWPAGTAEQAAPQPTPEPAPVPSQQDQAEQWSAFVAPDLAPVFADTPWLDTPPSPEGQAELLAGLRSIPPQAWLAAQALLQAAIAVAPHPKAIVPVQVPAQAEPQPQPQPDQACLPSTDPRRFLTEVMNDPSVPLALRIEAAKALLPHTGP